MSPTSFAEEPIKRRASSLTVFGEVTQSIVDDAVGASEPGFDLTLFVLIFWVWYVTRSENE